ncbi:uncharacterized protein LOC143465141 [Clavelina lepadiformis]|uniref:uncharacterized protein LOC143465141 n=1 Tax=Clavelina lepadiformis TaxID=159417 RepID=UPI0040427F3F
MAKLSKRKICSQEISTWSITLDIKKIYKLYFGCPLGDQDKKWAPHQICTACSTGLHNWLHERTSSMPFAIFTIWREPKDHIEDCYFCLINVKGFSSKTKSKTAYPNLDLARILVPHDASLPVPLPPHGDLESVPDEVEDSAAEGSSTDPSNSTESEYETVESSKPILFSQKRLNDLIRDLSLAKAKSELLASRLKENNLLEKDVVISHYRKRDLDLAAAFTVDGLLCYSHNINELFQKLGEAHIVDEWRFLLTLLLREV